MNYKIIPYTLIFVKNNSKILLGLKKRGLGQDKWNGFGGKIEKNETLMEGAIRELKEESNLSVKKLNHLGVLVYQVPHRSRIDLVHVFTTNEYFGTPSETEEMIPQWYDVNNIPFSKMWPDAKLWFDLMLDEKYFIAHVVYKNEEEICNTVIKEFENFSLVTEALNRLKDSL